MSVSPCWRLADGKSAPLTERGSPFEDPSPAGAESDSLVSNGEERFIEPKLVPTFFISWSFRNVTQRAVGEK